ncbi:MAG: hypothetical protein IJS66_01325 [Bacteroidales bacterium]|nr:hypothetical protein [Bacteroidales bacterium]
MLEDLKSAFEKLVSLYEKQKERADSLEAELAASREELRACRERLSELDGQIDDMKLMFAFSGAGDPALAKERIGKLVKEIDRCIKLLEK